MNKIIASVSFNVSTDATDLPLAYQKLDELINSLFREPGVEGTWSIDDIVLEHEDGSVN